MLQVTLLLGTTKGYLKIIRFKDEQNSTDLGVKIDSIKLDHL